MATSRLLGDHVMMDKVGCLLMDQPHEWWMSLIFKRWTEHIGGGFYDRCGKM
jgi:hypothetical protein